MSTKENKAIVRRFEKVFNEKRLDLADEFVSPDYIHHGGLAEPASGLEASKQRWAMFFAAIPDLCSAVEDVVAEGDKVAVRWMAEGTHGGDLAGMPPTGKRFRTSGISIYRLAGGKVAEQWENFDVLGMMQQLGVIPRADPGR
jgi:steroid delta-isomerase-like uncharacterized protein